MASGGESVVAGQVKQGASNSTLLPAAIGHLRGLFSLSVSSNPSLSWPPPPVVARGTRAMLEAAQRELTRPSTVRRVPLLLLGDFGAENAALRAETASRNTEQNLRFSDELVRTERIGGQTVIRSIRANC